MSNNKNVKKFKKSKTFGKKDEWQISKKDRNEVETEILSYSDYYIQEESIDDMILVLAKLGYVKIE